METKRIYEALFLVDSGLAAAGWDRVVELVQKILDRAQSRVISIRKWDERKLAYPVQGKARGTYILAYFECNSSMIRQIERDVQLSEEVLRVMIVRTDRMDPADMEKPTPAMLGHTTDTSDAERDSSADEPVEEVTAQEAID